jgi:hypothetical protein
MPTIVFSLLVVLAFLVQALPRTVLNTEDARLLIENTPEVRKARTTYQVPVVTDTGGNSGFFSFEVRASRTRGAASGLIGFFRVEKATGRVFREKSPSREEVDSFLIRDLGQQLLHRPSAANSAAEVDIRDKAVLSRLALGRFSYSAYGIQLGERFPNNTPSLRAAPLTRDTPTGVPMKGYAFSALTDPRVAPGVDAYLGADDRITELHIEVLPGEAQASMEWFFGKEFVTAISTDNVNDWQKLFGVEPLIARNKWEVFVDSPSRGVCACVTAAPNWPWAPMFVAFYIPGVSPQGETLADSILRRKTYCLGNQDER